MILTMFFLHFQRFLCCRFTPGKDSRHASRALFRVWFKDGWGGGMKFQWYVPIAHLNLGLVWGHAPQDFILIFDILRLLLVHFQTRNHPDNSSDSVTMENSYLELKQLNFVYISYVIILYSTQQYTFPKISRWGEGANTHLNTSLAWNLFELILAETAF